MDDVEPHDACPKTLLPRVQVIIHLAVDSNFPNCCCVEGAWVFVGYAAIQPRGCHCEISLVVLSD